MCCGFCEVTKEQEGPLTAGGQGACSGSKSTRPEPPGPGGGPAFLHPVLCPLGHPVLCLFAKACPQGSDSSIGCGPTGCPVWAQTRDHRDTDLPSSPNSSDGRGHDPLCPRGRGGWKSGKDSLLTVTHPSLDQGLGCWPCSPWQLPSPPAADPRTGRDGPKLRAGGDLK